MPLVLASGSPRRRQLLEAAGVDIHAIRPPDIPEDIHEGEDPVAFARRIALAKARAVPAPGHWVLAADTVVHVDHHLLGKPDDDDDARRMLALLSGRWHRVTSAWCLAWGGDTTGARRRGTRPLRGQRTSRVLFRPLSAAQIDRYVAGGEGRDKAGSYAIQGEGMVLVERVVGSYTNVVGLPVAPVLSHLRRVGLMPPASE